MYKLMKSAKVILCLFIVLAASCGKKEISQISSTEYPEVSSDDSKLSIKNRIVYYDSLLLTGKIKEIDEFGKTTMTSEYFEGELNGLQVSYYASGKVKEERYFERGKKEGIHKGWWENGNQKFISYFKNDVFDGNVKMWSENGSLFNDFNYINGHEEGLQRSWFPDGKLRTNYVAKNFRKYGLTGVKNCKSYTNEIQN